MVPPVFFKGVVKEDDDEEDEEDEEDEDEDREPLRIFLGYGDRLEDRSSSIAEADLLDLATLTLKKSDSFLACDISVLILC